MKRILTSILALFPFLGKGQTNSTLQGSQLDSLFDKVILKDSGYPVKKVDIFPLSEIKQKQTGTKLVYSPTQKLWDDNLRVILDNDHYTAQEKIAFIKEALNDESRDAFESINRRSIRFWSASKEAEDLIEGYFKQKNFEASEDPDVRFTHFEFRTKSLLPDAYDLIVQYFNERDTLEQKYPDEGDLVYRLIQLNKEEEAITYLTLLVDDYLAKKIKRLNLGSQNPPLYDGYVFEFLCFSENKEIAQKATHLLFYLLERSNLESYNLYPLTSYLDQERHLRMLEKRFDYYRTFDFSPIDLNQLEEGEDIRYSKRVPEAYFYFSFMGNDALKLGERKGREIWTTFVETMPYWISIKNNFETQQLAMLQCAFKDATLTVEEKKNFLIQAEKTKQFFNQRDYYGERNTRFLQLVLAAYPDRKIPREDFDRMQLNQVLPYSFPLAIPDHMLESNPNRTGADEQNKDQVVVDLNHFAKKMNWNPIEVTDRAGYYLSLESVESIILDFFRKNKRLVWFDAEGFTGDYVAFFEENFLPVLESSNLTDIQISQQSKQVEEDDYQYEIYIKNSVNTYLFDYTEHGTDWYQPQRLVKMLNLSLMDSKSSLRFVQVDSGDQTVIYLLATPSEIKPLLDAYGLHSFAISYDDDFNHAKTTAAHLD
ncbi:hypothetical protein [Myroides fluvii]|uniref:hypothetical protein n=1 Tax=Myroides fluvii TaxID=2572594 RepID=UPI00131B2832|nr:hypothetical protein [Myroides fluvii]